MMMVVQIYYWRLFFTKITKYKQLIINVGQSVLTINSARIQLLFGCTEVIVNQQLHTRLVNNVIVQDRVVRQMDGLIEGADYHLATSPTPILNIKSTTTRLYSIHFYCSN